MSRTLHIAIATIVSEPGNLVGNLAKISAMAAQAGDCGAQLLHTPEMSATGYGNYPDVLELAEEAGNGPIYNCLAEDASGHNVVLTAGFVEKLAPDSLCLAHYVVYPDGKYLVQRKHRITGVEEPLRSAFPEGVPVWDDSADVHSQLNFPTFEVAGVRCVVAICADLGIPRINEYFQDRKVELLLCPVGAGGRVEECVRSRDLATEEGRKKYLNYLQRVFFPGEGVTDCIKYRRALAAVNQGGWDGRQHAHVGHGMVINAMGEVEAFFHGRPNLDRQRALFASGVIDAGDCLPPDGR